MPRKLKTIVQGDLSNNAWGALLNQQVSREFEEGYFYPKPHAIALLSVLIKDHLGRKYIPPLDQGLAEHFLWSWLVQKRQDKAKSYMGLPIATVELLFGMQTAIKALKDTLLEVQNKTDGLEDSLDKLNKENERLDDELFILRQSHTELDRRVDRITNRLD